MNTVKVKKAELLAKIQANRSSHRAEFEKALGKYRELAIDELDKMLAEARAGRKIRRKVELVEPADHTKDYDRVIGMLTMHIEDEIEIEAHEFAQYVNDDWSWKEQFSTVNASYLAAEDRD